MKIFKKFSKLTSFVAILSLIIQMFVGVMPAFAATILDCNSYDTCKAAMTAAVTGDTVNLTASFSATASQIATTGTNAAGLGALNFQGKDGIIFEGNGFTISGPTSTSTLHYGILLSSTSSGGSDNNTIKNVKVSGFYNGLVVGKIVAPTYKSSGNTFLNVESSGNRQYGTHIMGNGNIFTNFIAKNNTTAGVYIPSTTSNNIFDGGELSGNKMNGINSQQGSGHQFKNLTIKNNGTSPSTGGGVILFSATGHVFDNVTVENNFGYGFNLQTANGHTIKNSVIKTNSTYGIDSSGSGSSIFNNIFNNTNNVRITGSPAPANTWNVALSSGTNIIGGPNLGGNFWTNPFTTGFSDICADANVDGICDIAYTVATNNIDNYPLAIYIADTTLPVITLNGVTPMDVELNTTYIEPGATWTDNVDGSGVVTNITGSVNTSVLGPYQITYSKTDAAKNEAIPVVRTVNVVDTTAPTTSFFVTGGTLGDDGWYKGVTPPEVTLSAEVDAVIYWQWDNEGWNFGFTDQSPAVSEGEKTLEFYSVDLSTNEEAPHQTLVVKYDGSAPVIAPHGDITLDATSPSGAVVDYTLPDANDNFDATAPAICMLVPGSLFPIGTTIVNCNKTDTAGNTAIQTSFDVNVTEPTAITLTYNAGVGGSITGDLSQSLMYGVDGTAVTAVPDTGYSFVDWSDGVTTSTRSDLAVDGNIDVTANFKANSYNASFIVDGVITNVPTDFGAVINKPFNPSKSGYTFAGWSLTVPDLMPANNLEFVATWTVDPNVVTTPENNNNDSTPIPSGTNLFVQNIPEASTTDVLGSSTTKDSTDGGNSEDTNKPDIKSTNFFAESVFGVYNWIWLLIAAVALAIGGAWWYMSRGRRE